MKTLLITLSLIVSLNAKATSCYAVGPIIRCTDGTVIDNTSGNNWSVNNYQQDAIDMLTEQAQENQVLQNQYENALSQWGNANGTNPMRGFLNYGR